MKKFTSIVFAGIILAIGAARADESADLRAELQYKTELRDTLKSDIAQISSEKSRCDHAKKNWTVATVVGGVGVVGTGVGVIVQANKLKKQKEELSAQQAEMNKLKPTTVTTKEGEAK